MCDRFGNSRRRDEIGDQPSSRNDPSLRTFNLHKVGDNLHFGNGDTIEGVPAHVRPEVSRSILVRTEVFTQM